MNNPLAANIGGRVGRAFFLVLGFLLSPISLSHASDFQAKVIHITDGDTITVLNEVKEEIKVRLNGIDCPEIGQAFGKKSKDFTRNLSIGQSVTIHSYDQDRYGRTIGDVILKDGRNLSQELVKAGYAWWFFKYSDDEQLGTLEVSAKIAKVGLWADKDPTPPWIYRHRNELATLPLSRPPPSSSLSQPSRPISDLPILGNRRSHKYHRPDCPSYHLIAPKNRLPFNSSKEAEDAGFQLAGNCPH